MVTVHACLSHLGVHLPSKLFLCTSHMVNSRTLDKLGQDLDASVLSWKDNLLPRVQKVVSERIIVSHLYRAWGRLADYTCIIVYHLSSHFASVCKKHSQ